MGYNKIKKKEQCYCEVVAQGGWCLYYGLGEGVGQANPSIICRRCREFKYKKHDVDNISKHATI